MANAQKNTVYTMTGESLTKAFRLLDKVVEKRTYCDIIKQVLIVSKPRSITLTTTDLDSYVTVEVETDSSACFEICAPFKPVKEFLSKVKGEVYFDGIEYDKFSVLKVQAGSANVSFQGPIASDFPTFSTRQLEPIYIDGAKLGEMLEFVAPAISTEETRYYLNGVFLHFSAGYMGIVATDGHRLHHIETPSERAPGKPRKNQSVEGWILPRKQVCILQDMLKSNALLHFGVNDAHFVASVGSVTIQSKLIDGCFPDFQRVIPSHGSATKCKSIDSGALSDVAARIASACGDKHKPIKFTFEGDTLKLSAKNETGEISEMINATDNSPYVRGEGGEVVQNGNCEIGYNSHYWREAAKAFGSGLVDFFTKGPAEPARLELNGKSDRLVVIMPLRI